VGAGVSSGRANWTDSSLNIMAHEGHPV